MKPMKILNSKGEPIVLNEREQRVAAINQRKCNALGYEVQVTTLTTISKKVTEQKFFEENPADFIPMPTGNGAWSTNITTYRSFALGDDFATGILDTGANNSRMASADAAVDSMNIKIYNWAKKIGYTLFDLEFASKSGNWDLVTSKEKARKKNWDLGIQKIAFLGLAGDSNVKGLYNQSGITTDTTTLTAPISSLTPAALKIFCAQILNVYRENCLRTTWPTHFTIPESDYLGLAAPASSDFPIKSAMAVLEETFKVMTKNPNFKIQPCVYGDQEYNTLGKQTYVLSNYDEESLVMNVPVPYTSTLANSMDNFSFENAAYGQFTGVLALRPQELYYLQF